MLKRLFFCIKLQISHNLCIRCIVLLDFLNFLSSLFRFHVILFSFLKSNIVVFNLILVVFTSRK